jgi:hypothetical protein
MRCVVDKLLFAVLSCVVAVFVQALQAELFLEVVGQESIPWTMAWTL